MLCALRFHLVGRRSKFRCGQRCRCCLLGQKAMKRARPLMQMAWRNSGSVRRTDKTATCFIFSTGVLYASSAYRAVLPSFFISPLNHPTPGAVCLFHRAAIGKPAYVFHRANSSSLAVDELSTAILLSHVLRFSSQRHSVAEQGNGSFSKFPGVFETKPNTKRKAGKAGFSNK